MNPNIIISKPKWVNKVEQERFYNRKGFYGWNGFAVVNDQKVFIWFSVQAPGSYHDSRIHNESWLKVKDEREFDYK